MPQQTPRRTPAQDTTGHFRGDTAPISGHRQRAAVIGPAERLGGTVVLGDERHDLGDQLLAGTELTPLEQPPGKDAARSKKSGSSGRLSQPAPGGASGQGPPGCARPGTPRSQARLGPRRRSATSRADQWLSTSGPGGRDGCDDLQADVVVVDPGAGQGDDGPPARPGPGRGTVAARSPRVSRRYRPGGRSAGSGRHRRPAG